MTDAVKKVCGAAMLAVVAATASAQDRFVIK